MREEYEAYCDHLYKTLVDRYKACGGRFPFIADVATNRPSNDPRNFMPEAGQVDFSHTFCANAMLQYGMLRGNASALAFGEKLLDDVCEVALTTRFFVKNRKEGNMFQGQPMIAVGAIVDSLKTIKVLEERGERKYGQLKRRLVERARPLVKYILDNHYDTTTREFWEENGPDGKPVINGRGHIICDPGHTTECAGFLAELSGFLRGTERKRILAAAWGMNAFVTEVGFSERGVMYKNVDLLTRRGVSDALNPFKDGIDYTTAPWWNVREHCASSARIHLLTKDPRALEGWRNAWNATYKNYPNPKIGGLMVQTLDANTLKPLPIHPATGNLDPMHDARAREREIEVLEELMQRQRKRR